MNAAFSCVGCGRCCNGLRLPLTVDEALAWINRGGGVEIHGDAIPWPSEPAGDQALIAYRRERSFEGRSGDLPIRVTLRLMAAFDGPCPNLSDDHRCRIYADRPFACRIYPAELNPFIPLAMGTKLCPPDAWSSQGNGSPISFGPETEGARRTMRNVIPEETSTLAAIAADLCLNVVALANHGLVVFRPPVESLLASLVRHRARDTAEVTVSSWSFVSDQIRLANALKESGCVVEHGTASLAWTYMSFATVSTAS